MRKQLIVFILCLSLVSSLFSQVAVFAANEDSKKDIFPIANYESKYIIKFKDIEKGKLGLSKRKKIAGKSFKRLNKHVTATLTDDELADLKKDPNIEYIEKDNIISMAVDTVTQNVYQIHAPEVHENGIFGTGVKVAVMDTGVHAGSAELNVAEGVSFVPSEPTPDDLNGHGTLVAGILAALKDDKGLVGVAPEVELYNIKVLDANGNGTYSGVIQGIEWAIDHDIDIISMSFVGSEYSQALEEVIALAYQHGILMVAATGNEGKENVSYPAKFDDVIAVGAVDHNGQLASFSNQGSEVELVAPGVNIQGLSLADSYLTASGTSLAVPHVAGVAALIAQKHPEYTNVEMRRVLSQYAIPLGDALQFGHGHVDAQNATQEQMINSNITGNPPINDGDTAIPIRAHYINGCVNASVLGSVYQNPTVTEDTYCSSTKPNFSIANTEYPTSYDQTALNNVNLKVDQAPFSVGIGNENISTLNGGLSLQYTDLTLPGRNGLSFSLNRIYDSSSSQFYDMDVASKDIYLYRVYPYMELTYDRMDRNGNIYHAFSHDRMNQVSVGFYPPTSGQLIGDPIPFKRYFEDGWLEYYSGYWICEPAFMPVEDFSSCYGTVMESLKEMEGTLDYYGNFYGPSAGGNYYRLWSSYSNATYFLPLPVLAYAYTGYFNQTIDKTYEETMFPLGKGWSWNISSIESKRGKKYLHLAGKGTYEIDGSNKLVGYPWKDLTLNTNTSVIVNGETSYYDLKTLDNIHQYFNREGKLIQISDAYGNHIQFKYANVNPYGKVLTGITDAIGNTITISYSSSNVLLTMGDRTVTYTKQSLWGKEFLSSVQDAGGRTTRYHYSYKNAEFNFPSNTTANKPMNNDYGLLTQVTHPTSATTYYTYESSPVTRYFGASGYNQAYRVAQRHDKIGTQTYNQQSFSYTGDVGRNYSSSFSFSTTVSDGRKNTTYTHYKQYVSDKVPATYYTTNITEVAGNLQRKETRTYDQTRRLPEPLSSTITYVNGTATSTPVTYSQTFDDYGNVLTSTDPNGIQTIYSYDSNTHLLSSVTQPLNASLSAYMQYARNNLGSLTQILVKDNHSSGTLRSQTNIAYDNFGNPISIIVKDDTRNISISQEYSTTYSNAFISKRSTNIKNVDGGVSTVTEQMKYNKLTGMQTNYTDGKGFVTSYQYDKLDRITKATFPDNSFVSLTYNDALNKIAAVDETGLTTVTQWNALGWKTSEGISGSGLTTYGYDSNGRLVWSRDARNYQTTYAYDAWNRLTKTTTPDGSSSVIVYDDTNRTSTTTDAESNKYRTTYDKLGRTTKEEWIKASGTVTLGSYTYDYVGNTIQSIDGNANTTTYGYDSLSRLVSVTDAENRTTRYGYSLAGQLKVIEYADGNKMLKQYDELGRLIKQTDPMGWIEKYYYDANSNLIKSVDRKGQVQTYSYNNRNFMTSNATSSETITYTYDTAGRRLSMQDATGTTSYSYDQITKRLKNLTYPDGKTISYTYDNQGNRTRMTDPFGFVTAYSYDSRNRLTDVGSALNNWDATYGYKRNNLLSTVQFRNGVISTNSFNGTNLTGVAQTKTGGAKVNSFAYTYDNNGNQVGKTENGTAYSFGYDKLNRIQTSSQFNETYTYDDRGNRLTLQSKGAMNISSTNYTYDDRNQLTQVRTKGGTLVSYRYNGDGLLYERMENGQTTRYYNDGANIIAEATVDNGVARLKARYIRGKGLIALVDANGNKSYYMHNGHGDVVGLTDSTGNVINQYSYDIWGNPLSTQETVSNPFRYSGEYWDETTGLQYLRSRWYDPSLGRFITEDSYEGNINNPLTLNMYTYVLNNPLRWIDPTGNRHVDPDYYFNLYTTMMGYCQQTNSDCSGLQRKIDLEIAYASGIKGDIFTGMSSTQYDNELLLTEEEAEDMAIAMSSSGTVPIMRSVKIGFRAPKVKPTCNCFAAGTKVLTDEGEKPIEEIEVGDKVLAKSDETGEVAYKEVVGLFQKQADEIYYIHIGDEIIEVTAEHPFWLNGKGWTEVKDLKVGDLLVSSDGSKLAIDKIEKEPREATVYNFEVKDFNSYFVSNLGIWVHNCAVKDFKNYSAKEIERKFDLKKGGFHQIKQDIVKDLTNKNSPYKDQMKKVGSNPDIHLSSDGTIRIMSRDGKTSFDTKWNINSFLP